MIASLSIPANLISWRGVSSSQHGELPLICKTQKTPILMERCFFFTIWRVSTNFAKLRHWLPCKNDRSVSRVNMGGCLHIHIRDKRNPINHLIFTRMNLEKKKKKKTLCRYYLHIRFPLNLDNTTSRVQETIWLSNKMKFLCILKMLILTISC